MDIKDKLKEAKAPVTKEYCCIYRVPSDIRGVKEDAYTPKVVSIGPFHHNGHLGLKNMERLKLSYCKSFLERTQSLDSWIHYIDVELNFHNCYSDTLEFTKEELRNIIIVDSGFIFELFISTYQPGSTELTKDDWFISNRSLRNTVMKDLLLLENQLPFFILEHLFNLSFSSRFYGTPSLLELTFFYFGFYNRFNLKVNDIVSIRHFTDLVRTFHLQHPLPSRNLDTKMHLPSATELSEAGVIFNVKTESSSLLDLTFSGNVFQIPKLIVDDGTELLFRNIMALEQCHYPLESYITDYVDVLDHLVNTGKDVDILVHKEVLVNSLGDSDSVANFLNGMMKYIIVSDLNDMYSGLYDDLDAFYKSPCNIWTLKSTLKREYCRGPWQTAASIAAIILLIMSLVQTVCSILQVIQQ